MSAERIIDLCLSKKITSLNPSESYISSKIQSKLHKFAYSSIIPEGLEEIAAKKFGFFQIYGDINPAGILSNHRIRSRVRGILQPLNFLTWDYNLS